jgi:hypothetical protein
VEVDAQRNVAGLSAAALATMAHGKVAPIVTTMAAMAEASGRPALLGPIEASLNHIAVASQHLDDIGDWREDLHVRHLTYFLAQVLPGSDPWPDEGTVQDGIDREWSDVGHLQQVLEGLEAAQDAVRGISCPGWTAYVEGYTTLADEHLTRALARHLARVLGPIVHPPEGRRGSAPESPRHDPRPGPAAVRAVPKESTEP